MFVEDFPGGPVVKILPSNARDVGLILSRGTKIPRDSQPSKKEKEHKQKTENIVTNSIKALKKVFVLSFYSNSCPIPLKII